MARVEYLNPPYQDLDQQSHSAELGMWVFLATEVLFFGVLFTCYAMLRMRWPAAFRHGSEDLNLWMGGINTAVLLTSSTFMALAVRAARAGDSRWIITHLAITAALGMVFLGLKATEYSIEYREHLIPGLNFANLSPEDQGKPASQQNARPEQERLFMIFYFVMTGFHAVHMLVGIGVIVVLIILTGRGAYGSGYHSPVEIAGLYWHFVDIVWVFLYPALYLLRQS